MKDFRTDVFLRIIRKHATAYGVPQPSARHGGNEPPEDATAARVLFAIAEAVQIATERTEEA